MAESARTSRRRRARRRRLLATGVGVAVVGTGTAVALAATSGGGPNLRLGTVRVGSVDQTVEASGTVSSSLKLTPSFATSGTVASVYVTLGQRVSNGQVLAKLDTTSLQADVDSASSTLASAKQTLEADESGQTNSGNNSANNSAANIVTIAYITNLTAPSTSISVLIRQVEDGQTAVINAQRAIDAAQPAIDAAQHTVDADVTQNTTLRNAQQQACATSSTPSPSASSSDTSASNSDCAGAMAAYEASADTLATDMATLDAKIAAQDGFVKQLDTGITSLDKLVDELQSAAAKSDSTSRNTPSSTGTSTPSRPNGSTRNGSTPSGHASQPSGGTGRSSGSTGTSPSRPRNGSQGNGSQSNGSQGNGSQPASAAQLAADQKAIDAAEAELTVAQQNLAAATLTSPAAGKVAAIGLTAGQSSSGGTITIVGTGIPGVDATVPLAQIDQVKVGQHVTVAADGVSTQLHGAVASIGLLSTTSGSSTAYPVTIQLDARTPQVYDGTGADLVIDTGSARNVITVPNSAIHTGAGGRHTVTVVDGGKTSTVLVTLGIAGSDVTEVKSGLKAGQRVELADLSQQLPASTSSSSNNRFRVPGFAPGGFRNFGR